MIADSRIEQLRTELFALLEREGEPVVPKARRHGPSIQVGRQKGRSAK